MPENAQYIINTGDPRTAGLNWPGWPPNTTGWTPGPEFGDGRSGPRILIVNPMHIVRLSTKNKSRLVKFIEFFRSLTEKWFSHVLLLLFLFLYCCLGAWIMMMVEGGLEQRTKVGAFLPSSLFSSVLSTVLNRKAAERNSSSSFKDLFEDSQKITLSKINTN